MFENRKPHTEGPPERDPLQDAMVKEARDDREEIKRLRNALASAYQFIDGNVHYSQPAYDMGPEPSDQFSYEAGPVCTMIQRILGLGHDEILNLK